MKKLTLPPRYKMMKGMGARLGLSSNRVMSGAVGGMIKEMEKMSVGPKLKPLRFKL
jgi:hypothetical protein